MTATITQQTTSWLESSPICLALVGGGSEAVQLLDSLSSVSTVRVSGICDDDATAPGVLRAQQLGIAYIPTLEALVTRSDVQVIVDLTSTAGASADIARCMRPDQAVITSHGARLVVSLAQKATDVRTQNGHDQRGVADVVAVHSRAVASSATQLTQTSLQMKESADGASATVGIVSGAAEQVKTNLQTVSLHADKMSAKIGELAKSARDAARVATSAVKAAEATNATIGKLGESSAEIGKVIKVITSIAQQTNLLALNATIEAARAGEAGKGFAVVATEVKELAKETAAATEDISQKIEAIQGDTRGAVAAIAEIGGIIGQINDIQNSIGSAFEEQIASTNEISRNVSEAAQGSSDIAEIIGTLGEIAQINSVVATEAQDAAAALAHTAGELLAVVGRSNGA